MLHSRSTISNVGSEEMGCAGSVMPQQRFQAPAAKRIPTPSKGYRETGWRGP